MHTIKQSHEAIDASSILMNGARWIEQRETSHEEEPSIGSLDGRRYTRPHTNVSDMFLWASQHGVKCRTTPRRVLVTHGTLCCREPLITDAESISISRSFTTCDAVYANRTSRDSPCLGLPGNWLACVTACGSTDLRIRASISTILGMVPGRRLRGS